MLQTIIPAQPAASALVLVQDDDCVGLAQVERFARQGPPSQQALHARELAEVAHGLRQAQATVSAKYLYDEAGCTLFEAITALPEYYPTRTERAILRAQAADIAESVGRCTSLIELGAGNCDKVRSLLPALQPKAFVGVDIAAEFVQQAVHRLAADFPGLDARAISGDITHSVRLPADLPDCGRLVFYPGSSIGNFDPVQAVMLLGRMHGLLNGDGGLLIGIDLPKPVVVLEAAYNDAAGVTAAFNLNVLSHLNTAMGMNFDVDDWQHFAFFNAEHSRIEMHLRAQRACSVRWPGGERRFVRGESIHTENSYKYPLTEFLPMLAQAGFGQTQAWTDTDQWFAVIHAHA